MRWVWLLLSIAFAATSCGKKSIPASTATVEPVGGWIQGIGYVELHSGQVAEIFGRGLGRTKIEGRVTVVKTIMGKKTVFTKSSTERKDVDVLQVLIDLPEGTTLPVGFEVDVRINRAIGKDALFRQPSLQLRAESPS